MALTAPSQAGGSLDDGMMNAVAFLFTGGAFLDDSARAFVELYARDARDARVRRAVESAFVEPIERQPAKHRHGRYRDQPDQHGNPRVGNAKWFRDWRESSYTQYLKLHPAAVYEAEPERDVTLRAEFKQKTRLPLRLFQELRDEMKNDPFMKERETVCPLEIKLIASLRY